MTPQIISERTNASHFGRVSNTRNQSPPGKPAALPAKKAPAKATISSGPAENGQVETLFRFEAPAAKMVLLAGDFTGWNQAPIKMIKDVHGVWHGIISLKPGRHAYRFLVDDEWQNDPNQPNRVANDFGTFNNVVEISQPHINSKRKKFEQPRSMS